MIADIVSLRIRTETALRELFVVERLFAKNNLYKRLNHCIDRALGLRTYNHVCLLVFLCYDKCHTIVTRVEHL